MAKNDGSSDGLQPREVIKMPTEEDLIEEKRQYVERVYKRLWESPEIPDEVKAQKNRELQVMLDNPRQLSAMVNMASIMEQSTPEEARELLAEAAKHVLDEKRNPKPVLKLWTGDEDGRRTKPRDGKAVPDRS